MQEPADRGDWYCPLDGSILERTAVAHGTAGVCRSCRGIWIPAPVLFAAATELRDGWIGYVHFDSVPQSEGACPDDGALLFHLASWDLVFERCPLCRGTWLPGAALHALHERARRRAGNDDPFPSPVQADRRVDLATQAAGFDPDTVDELVVASIGFLQ